MTNANVSNLKPIFSYSFPSNHLLQISLVNQKTQNQNYKKEYFFFITLVPGAVQNGNRTFSFEQRFTIKAECDRIMSLAHAIKAYCLGQQNLVGKFSIFVDSSKSAFNQQKNNSNKSIFLNTGNDKQNNPIISLTFKQGQTTGNAFSMSVPSALAFVDVLNFMTNKCLELEFSKDDFVIKNSSVPIKIEQKLENIPNFPINVKVDKNINQQNSVQNIEDNFSNTLNNLGLNDDEIWEFI